MWKIIVFYYSFHHYQIHWWCDENCTLWSRQCTHVKLDSELSSSISGKYSIFEISKRLNYKISRYAILSKGSLAKDGSGKERRRHFDDVIKVLNISISHKNMHVSLHTNNKTFNVPLCNFIFPIKSFELYLWPKALHSLA